MFRVLFVLLMASLAFAGEIRYSLDQFVEEGLTADPQVAELKFGTEAKKNQIRKLKSEAILPTFYFGGEHFRKTALRLMLRHSRAGRQYDSDKQTVYAGKKRCAVRIFKDNNECQDGK